MSAPLKAEQLKADGGHLALGRLALRGAGRQRELIALGCWTAAWLVILAPHGGIAWHFFVKGSELLFGGHYGAHPRPGGLHLYASYPSLQIGPLAFGAAELIRHLGPDQGVAAAQLIMTAMGLVTLEVIRRITLAARPELAARPGLRRAFLGGGALFMIAWVELAVAYGHLDDALALMLAVLALRAAVAGRPVLTGLAVGLAADAKPWALIFLPVLLLAGGLRSWRRANQAARPVRASLAAWVLAAGCALAVVLAGWLPFFAADPGSVAAARFTIANLPDSALRAMGITAKRTPPWDRSAQVISACVLGTLAIWRGRWPAVILLGTGARIALDPAAHGYYTAGVMAGALIWDLLGARRPFPLWSVLCFCALNVVPLLTARGPLRGDFRLWLVVAVTLATLLGPARWYWKPQAPSSPRPADQSGATTTPSMPGPV